MSFKSFFYHEEHEENEGVGLSTMSFPCRRESRIKQLDYPVKLDNDKTEVKNNKILSS